MAIDRRWNTDEGDGWGITDGTDNREKGNCNRDDLNTENLQSMRELLNFCFTVVSFHLSICMLIRIVSGLQFHLVFCNGIYCDTCFSSSYDLCFHSHIW